MCQENCKLTTDPYEYMYVRRTKQDITINYPVSNIYEWDSFR